MKQVIINLYSFSELSKEGQRKAIDEHQEFLAGLSLAENENYADRSDEEITEDIEANEYLFFQDGSLAHCTTYTGKHQKSGITEFHFKGNTVVVPA